jgi:hypothetical protein
VCEATRKRLDGIGMTVIGLNYEAWKMKESHREGALEELYELYMSLQLPVDKSLFLAERVRYTWDRKGIQRTHFLHRDVPSMRL